MTEIPLGRQGPALQSMLAPLGKPQSPNLYTFKEHRNQFRGIDSAKLCSLACGNDK